MNNLENLDITKQISLFRNFLIKSWPILDEVMLSHNWEEDGYFTTEWIQANWEILVEREITENKAIISSLSMPYPNDRITKMGKKYEYIVVAQPLENKIVMDLHEQKKIDFSLKPRLFGFCKALDSGFGIYPPFDICNLCIDKTKVAYTAFFNELKFYLKKVP